LKVDLNKFVKGQKIAGLTTINFQNNITDIGWMNEVLAYQLYRDAGAHAPRTSYAKVYITVPGRYTRHYIGLYSISENVDENFIEDRFGTRKGAILKPSTRTPFTWMGDTWPSYNQTYDPKTDLTDTEKARIIEFCRFVSYANDADFAARIGQYVDIDAFARYFAVLVWIANADSLLQIGQNYYVFLHPKTNKLTFIAWDQDGSFGNFRNQAADWTIYYPWNGNNTFLGRIYNVEAFRTTLPRAHGRAGEDDIQTGTLRGSGRVHRAGDSAGDCRRRHAVAAWLRPGRQRPGGSPAVRQGALVVRDG